VGLGQPQRYANDEERQATAQECQRLHRVAVALERVACSGAQHEEARCMTDIAQQSLETMEQHARTRVVKIEWAHQAQLKINVVQHTE